MFHAFLSTSDADRVLHCLDKLGRHDVRGWALTGGLAIELHHLIRGCRPSRRPLNDIDFIADSFGAVPLTLADDFLFRHIHPQDPPGRTMLQAVDPESALRIDVFRACSAAMSRTSRIDLGSIPIRLISLEDLVARAARLALDLAEGIPTPAKHASDYLRLAKLVNRAEVEEAWRDHRKPKHPAAFEDADRLLQQLIPASPGLLTVPEYSTDIEAVCPRCAPAAGLSLADPSLVLSLLGYC